MNKLANDIRKTKINNSQLKIPKTYFELNFSSSEIFTETSSSSYQFREDFLSKIKPIRNIPVIFVEGILLLNDLEVADECDAKYFVKLDHETCLVRRKDRTYDPPDPVGYFEQVVWPCYVSNLEELEKSKVKNITYLDGKNSIADNFFNILCDLIRLIA